MTQRKLCGIVNYHHPVFLIQASAIQAVGFIQRTGNDLREDHQPVPAVYHGNGKGHLREHCVAELFPRFAINRLIHPLLTRLGECFGQCQRSLLSARRYGLIIGSMCQRLQKLWRYYSAR